MVRTKDRVRVLSQRQNGVGVTVETVRARVRARM